MIATAVSLVVYMAAAFFGEGDTRYAVFDNRQDCVQAVQVARSQGIFASDCVAVTLPAPKRQPTS